MPNSIDSHVATSHEAPQPFPLRSGHRPFMRLLWKELLTLRAFAGLLAAVLSVTCGIQWAWRPEISLESSLLLLSLPQLVAIVFAIGSGALLFSQEDESGTLDFLRGMGVSPRALVNAKLTAGLVSMILLGGGTAAIGWRPPSAPEMSSGRVVLTVMSCGTGLVVLLWTSLCSMAIRRELPTVCCGLLGALLLKPFIDNWDEMGLLVLLGVLASGLWLLCQVAASRWMGTGGWWWQTTREATVSNASTELAHDNGTISSPTHFGSASKTIPVAFGSTILAGIVLWLLMMMWWPHSSRAGRWPETLELVWSMLVGSVLGWWPVRLERGEPQPLNRASVRNWRHEFANGPIPWLLVWWLLSLGLMCGYRSDTSFESSLATTFRFFRDEVLPWSILAFSSFRLMARWCSGRWMTWPLSVVPLGVGWCVWWLLAMLGEPAWWGLLMIGALFTGASWCQWQLTQRGRSVWRANLCSAGGTVGVLLLCWGFLNWWRVAEIPNDWVGATKPTPLPTQSDAEAHDWAARRAELAALIAMVQPAPLLRWTDGRDFPCFNNDWNIIDGRQTWSDVSKPTLQWVESNESAINEALNWSPTSRWSAHNSQTDNRRSRTKGSVATDLTTEHLRSNSNLWLLAARRCEHAEQLDEAWRLHRLGFHASRQLMTPEPTQYHRHVLNQYWHYERLAVWVWHPQQTSERLKQAIAEVLADGENTPPPEVILPHEFRRFRDSQRVHADTDRTTLGDWSWERWLFRRLCPAEFRREQRMIDGLEAAHLVAFADLRPLTRDLSAHWNQPAPDSPPPVNVVRPTWLIPSSRVPGIGVPWVRGPASERIARTPRLNFPRNTKGTVNAAYGQEWEAAVIQFLSAEGQRRALLLFMAQRAFELEHQRPPKSADELVPAYLPQHPVTVVSGVDLWTLSQKPRNPLWPNDPTDPPARQAFHWRTIARESPSDIRLEISWTTRPHLVFVSR